MCVSCGAEAEVTTDFFFFSRITIWYSFGDGARLVAVKPVTICSKLYERRQGCELRFGCVARKGGDRFDKTW